MVKISNFVIIDCLMRYLNSNEYFKTFTYFTKWYTSTFHYSNIVKIVYFHQLKDYYIFRIFFPHFCIDIAILWILLFFYLNFICFLLLYLYWLFCEFNKLYKLNWYVKIHYTYLKIIYYFIFSKIIFSSEKSKSLSCMKFILPLKINLICLIINNI